MVFIEAGVSLPVWALVFLLAKRGGGSVNGEGLPQPMITPPPTTHTPNVGSGGPKLPSSQESQDLKNQLVGYSLIV